MKIYSKKIISGWEEAKMIIIQESGSYEIKKELYDFNSENKTKYNLILLIYGDDLKIQIDEIFIPHVFIVGSSNEVDIGSSDGYTYRIVGKNNKLNIKKTTKRNDSIEIEENSHDNIVKVADYCTINVKSNSNNNIIHVTEDSSVSNSGMNNEINKIINEKMRIR